MIKKSIRKIVSSWRVRKMCVLVKGREGERKREKNKDKVLRI